MSAKVKITVKAANNRDMECDVHVFPNYGRNFIANLFVITERKDNPGMSVTNASEYIATHLVNQYKFDPEECIFIEHYDYQDGRSTPTWDQVAYTWVKHLSKGWQASLPKWSPIPRDLHRITSRMEEDDTNEMADEIVKRLMEAEEET